MRKKQRVYLPLSQPWSIIISAWWFYAFSIAPNSSDAPNQRPTNVLRDSVRRRQQPGKHGKVDSSVTFCMPYMLILQYHRDHQRNLHQDTNVIGANRAKYVTSTPYVLTSFLQHFIDDFPERQSLHYVYRLCNTVCGLYWNTLSPKLTFF